MPVVDRYKKIKEYLLSQQDPSDLKALQAEEEVAQEARNVAGIGSGIDKIIASIGRTQANPDAYVQMQKLAGEGPNRVKEYLKNKYEQRKDTSSLAATMATAEEQNASKAAQQANEVPDNVKVAANSLSTNVTNKILTAKQIDAYLDQMEKAPDDSQRLQLGKQMIKILNSTEGKDAVGAEESKRLGSKLEFAFGGLTTGNYGQFGRDLDGFIKDARATSNAIKSGAEHAKGSYKELTGGKQLNIESGARAPQAGGGFSDPEKERRYQEFKRSQLGAK